MKSYYEKAETYVITGEYTEAAAELEKVPTSYKEQKLLLAFIFDANLLSVGTCICISKQPLAMSKIRHLVHLQRNFCLR